MHFRELLAAPKEDAAEIISHRFPVPRFVPCDQHKSQVRTAGAAAAAAATAAVCASPRRAALTGCRGRQARFLMARLNPSVTHNSTGGGGAAVITDDVSFGVFMEHLQKLAVQGS